jgi:RecJ-like exonuclease
VSAETCGVCGGDGRIANAFGGGEKRCPGCNGTGRRSEDTDLMRDVTKTKPSHHRAQDKQEAAAKQTWPSTLEGGRLATLVKESLICTEEVKARLVREIIEYEASHGSCTQTFSKKIRKQVVPRSPAK